MSTGIVETLEASGDHNMLILRKAADIAGMSVPEFIAYAAIYTARIICDDRLILVDNETLEAVDTVDPEVTARVCERFTQAVSKETT